MKVSVLVHGRFHAFELARGLHDQGYLNRLITTYPSFAARRIVGAGADVRSVTWLEARRRMGQWLGTDTGRLDVSVAKAFGAAAASRLPADGDILVGWSAATLEAIPVARDRGMRIIIERGSTHIEHQTEILTELYGRHGLNFTDTAPEIMERELAEYEAADAIAVPSRFAAETFRSRGVPAEKLLINPYGVDLSMFTSAGERPARKLPRILFVGRVGLRKGIVELLNAFGNLTGRAELHLVGPVEPAAQTFLSRAAAEGLVVRGAMPATDLVREYQDADIFCLPSWEEGFPLVLMQAMAMGLPAVVSDATGAADMIADGTEGLIVGTGDVGQLTEALAMMVDDAARRTALGQAARQRVSNGWQWQDYVERAVGHYRNILAVD